METGKLQLGIKRCINASCCKLYLTYVVVFSAGILQVCINSTVYQSDFLYFRSVSGTAVSVNQVYSYILRPVGTSLYVSCRIVVIDTITGGGRGGRAVFLGEMLHFDRNILGKLIQL